jgi:hypothetical protein
VHVKDDFHIKVGTVELNLQPFQSVMQSLGTKIRVVVVYAEEKLDPRLPNEVDSRSVILEVDRHARHHGFATLGANLFAG